MTVVNYAVAWIGISLVYAYNYSHTHGFVFVEIDKGILRGQNASTWRGERYFSFKGIPYAKPPVDEFRFKGPQEETAWAGVRDAVAHGAVCPQIDMVFKILRGQEDCLFLNVYTPALGPERLPVMVWIHGGMFMLGSGNDELYASDYLVEADVVLVTINYRLGALGFLSTEDDSAPGNAGMKDQVAALRWIRRNIAKFGGDPDNVTIFGGSSGGVCTHYHLLSPMSKGLFAKAIAQSGSALNTWGLSENGAEATVRLAKALGAKNPTGDTAKALEFLKTVPYGDIVKVQETILTEAELRMRIEFLFTPSVEKGVKSEEVFLSDSPLKILESGNFNKVPYITGYTSHEGYFLLNELEKPEMMNAGTQDTERFVPPDIKDKRLRNELAKLIREFYFDNKPIGHANVSNFVNLYSDAIFNFGVKRGTRLHLKSTNHPTYFYTFSYDGGNMNLLKLFLNIQRRGAVHGDEIGYLFFQKLLFWRTPKDHTSNHHVLQTMVRLWTNFAKYGDPTPAGDPLNWKPATIEKFNYLNISGLDTKLSENPDPERSNFWARAYEKYAALHH